MSSRRLASHIPFSRFAPFTSIRMASTIIGQPGRTYIQGEVLQRHREDHRFSIFKAKYD